MGVELFAGATVVIALVFGYGAKRHYDFRLAQLGQHSKEFEKLDEKVEKLEDKLTKYMIGSRNG